MSDMFQAAMSLNHRLDNLRAEHRELDEAIARLCSGETEDEVLVRRLKKRKLLIKDRILIIERTLGPDSQA